MSLGLLRTIAAVISGPSRTRKALLPMCSGPRNLEALGGRTLLSVSPMHAIAVHTLDSGSCTSSHSGGMCRVPDLQGYTFYLNSTNGKPAHTLVIKSVTYNRLGSASLTGTWQGDGPNGKTVKRENAGIRGEQPHRDQRQL